MDPAMFARHQELSWGMADKKDAAGMLCGKASMLSSLFVFHDIDAINVLRFSEQMMRSRASLTIEEGFPRDW